MPDTVTVHRLTPADLRLVRDLNALFGVAFEDAETYGAEPPGEAYLARLLAREHVTALVALDGGEVIGGLVAYELEKFEQARSEIYIYDLAVAQAHRRLGVATALIRRLQAEGEARPGARLTAVCAPEIARVAEPLAALLAQQIVTEVVANLLDLRAQRRELLSAFPVAAEQDHSTNQRVGETAAVVSGEAQAGDVQDHRCVFTHGSVLSVPPPRSWRRSRSRRSR